MESNAGSNQEQLSLDWLRFINPVTEHYASTVRGKNLAGQSISGWMHLLPDTILVLEPFVIAGAKVRVGACNPDSTNQTVVRILRGMGVEVYEGGDPSSSAYQQALQDFVCCNPDVICDMGGELAAMAVRCGVKPRAGLEATITGLHRLRKLELTFPVFDWNSVAIKDALHNRFHVGDSTWPAFTAMTGIGLFGRRVLVVGFGPVGRGVAERARNLGALVSVSELDPIRSLEALHFGCEVLPLIEGLRRADIVVTATGIDGVLDSGHFPYLKSGAVIFNVGHSNREIAVDELDSLPNAQMKPGIRRYTLNGDTIFLLNRGSMVNLGLSEGLDGSDAFDPFSAIMLAGMDWILSGEADNFEAGITPFPKALEHDIGRVTLARKFGS